MKIPELLLPAGNVESFFAGLEGGADAFYLGLRSFNARNRAKNFTLNQLQALLKIAQKEHKHVYVTLNTLIKNTEINELIDTLYILSQTDVSALIIQDWGVFYLIKKYFSHIPVHASTQMTNHNSLGANFSQKIGFERIILARELTLNELKLISEKTKIELEVFAHGSLCYSFSGMCYFSSYLGGMSANRGLCRQPCRRRYRQDDKNQYFFNLKDLQLIELLPEMMKLGIHSIKIEGRMKTPEYVFQVAKAYRMALDNPATIPQAKEILKFDFGREKTSYFIGSNVSNAINEKPYTGLYLGKVSDVGETRFSFSTIYPLQINDRIRILPKNGTDSQAIKLKKIIQNGSEVSHAVTTSSVEIETPEKYPQIGDLVFLTNRRFNKFSNTFSQQGKKLRYHYPEAKKKHLLSRIGSSKQLQKTELAIRIDTSLWIRKIDFRSLQWLIINLRKTDWQTFKWQLSILRKNKSKVIFELPHFISETDIPFYKSLIQKAKRNGFNHFMLSHLSQSELFHHQFVLSTNAQVYILNDASIQFLKEKNIKYYIYPIETDFPNLLAGKDRKGFVTLFFYPTLFSSRMPVHLQTDKLFQDKTESYNTIIKDGLTYVVPKLPVSLLQYRNKLESKGFHRFLIDLSFCKPSQNKFHTLLKKFEHVEAVQPASVFNFKMGLK